LCVSCHGLGENIHSYGYKPDPIFLGTPKKVSKGLVEPYFGFELEIENVSQNLTNLEAAESIDANSGYLYCKHDGTLDSGFEIVSHPMSFEFIEKELKDKESQLNKVFKLAGQGFRSFSTETCGFHVHMSLKSFSTLHLYRYLRLLMEHPRFTLKVSQRTPGNLQSWARLDGEPITLTAKQKRSAIRRSACNVSSNTLENRLFRGNLRKDVFHGRLELLIALYRYTLGCSIPRATPKDFYTWARKNRYQAALSYLQRTGALYWNVLKELRKV